MTDKKLTRLLEQLRRELAGAKAVDQRGRELLRALDADIHSLLERKQEGRSDESLLERLKNTIDHFEDSHPALTSALSNLLTFLNNAGI
jgi:hypothetical protein